MKRTGLSHSKLKRLKTILGVPEYVAVGILETIWHLTAREAPQGNIGKMSDQDIAMAIEWAGEPAQLISALVDSKWIDRCKSNRLVVHDWKDHCDNTTKLYIKRNHLSFVETCNNIIAPPLPEPNLSQSQSQSLALPAPDDSFTPEVEALEETYSPNDFEPPPQARRDPEPPTSFDALEDFDEATATKARHFWGLFCAQHHGKTILRSLHLDSSKREMRHFAGAIAKYGGEALDKLEKYYHSPPREDKGLSAYSIVCKLAINPNAEVKPPWEQQKNKNKAEANDKLMRAIRGEKV